MNRYKSTDSVKQYAAALEELHRPLEEHWLGIKSKYSLDANGSDIIYKHHMAKLEEIYLRTPHQDTPETLLHKRCVSPVTQLYGINGLVSADPGLMPKVKEREHGWTSNMHRDYAQKAQLAGVAGVAGTNKQRPISRGSDYCRNPTCAGTNPKSKFAERTKSARAANLPPSSPGRFEPLNQTSSSYDLNLTRSSYHTTQNLSPMGSSPHHSHTHTHAQDVQGSGNKHRPSSANAASSRHELKQDQAFLKQNYQYTTKPALLSMINQSKDSRHRCHPGDTQLSQDELVMLGLYRLDERQTHIYQQFVAMMAEMDSFDACHMVEDALKDATVGVSELFEDFGGCEEP